MQVCNAEVIIISIMVGILVSIRWSLRMFIHPACCVLCVACCLFHGLYSYVAQIQPMRVDASFTTSRWIGEMWRSHESLEFLRFGQGYPRRSLTISNMDFWQVTFLLLCLWHHCTGSFVPELNGLLPAVYLFNLSGLSCMARFCYPIVIFWSCNPAGYYMFLTVSGRHTLMDVVTFPVG